MFDPKPKKYPYTEKTDEHYLVVKKNRGIVFDENYPYIDDSAKAKFGRGFYRILLNVLAFPIARVRLGLKISGRDVLKRYKDVIEKGVVSCSNHVHMFDFLAVLRAVTPHRPNVLVWAKNVNGENGTMIRNVGGVPIPENDVLASKKYIRQVGEKLEKGGWLHIYPEGSMWEFYAPIRPFKRGVAYFACKHGKPVLPMGFSYREPGLIRKKIFGQIACVNLKIGEPIFPDPLLKGRAQMDDLTRRCHAEVCRLAGIDPKENIYPPVFDDDRRIDYY